MQAQQFQQFILPEWFGQEGIGASRQILRTLVAVGAGRYRDDDEFAGHLGLAQPAGGLQPIQHRHPHIHQHGIRLEWPHQIKCRLTVGRFRYLKAERSQHVHQHCTIFALVIRDQHPTARPAIANHRRVWGRLYPRWCSDRRQGQREPEPTTLAERALDGQHAAEQFHQPAADDQSQAGPLGGLRALTDPTKRLKQLAQFLGANAAARVGHGEANPPFISRDSKADLARVGKFDGIADQIEQNLPQLAFVASDMDGQAWISVGAKMQILLLGPHRKRTGDPLHKIAQIERFALHVQFV